MGYTARNFRGYLSGLGAATAPSLAVTGAITGASATLTGEVKAETGWFTKTPGANVVQVKLGDGDSGIGESADDTIIKVIAGTSQQSLSASAHTVTPASTFTGKTTHDGGFINSGTTQWSGSISAAPGASQTDYDFGHYTETVLRVGPTANITINSLAVALNSETHIIVNVATGFTLTLLHDDGATGTAGMRFLCPNAASYVLQPLEACLIWHDATTNRWRVIGTV